ncbi:uncharacterized protein LOC112087536 [Eutrema salsugineum]|uniref:uncharacterized protein LOC112087536 n=1 Tax=Eutrema salsugineum TaxID=72664 RepID=UPI000CED34BC|nr:uncharacterized protein LOC112087536 [Eutrema salsugineum]
MANSPLLLADLKADHCVQPVVARLLRFWEARNVKKGGELLGVDMLFLDEKSTVTQGSINVHCLNTFKHLLREGSIYTMRGFDVTRSNNNFKLCDSKFSIRFTSDTSFVEVPNSESSIPKQMLWFRSYDELLSLVNSNSELPDVIGELSMIKSIQNGETQITEHIMIQLRLSNDIPVTLSAFDALAKQLNQKLQRAGGEPRVILATNINPKFVGGNWYEPNDVSFPGKLFLNATSGTHFFFDNVVEASQNYTNQHCTIPRTAMEDSITTVSKKVGVQKLETITVVELNDFILKSPAQAIDFICTSKVIDIQTQNGWCYVSCPKCSKKLVRRNSTFTCYVCHNPNAVGVIRYRVELVVCDSKDNAVFVAFDTDMTKLTSVRAADAGATMDAGWEDNGHSTPPPFITNIVRKTYMFQLKLSEYNFTPKHQSFTISRIFSAPQAIPTPKFETQDGAEFQGGISRSEESHDHADGIKNPTSRTGSGFPGNTMGADGVVAAELQAVKKARKE